MRILYLDCFSGISGDMAMAALVDAGADRDYIEQELKKIAIEPFTLEWKRVNKSGISALKMDVIVDPDHHPHHHRHYADIVKLINQAGFNPYVTALSLDIFAKIGAAEAKIHNVPMDQVHFHEVGAIDSIVDIIGVALAVDSLQVDKVISSPVPLGTGTVRCDHGLYPVPAPATLEIMKGLPIAASRHAVELTTPTGAGIIAGLVSEFSDGLPAMVVNGIGYGAGTRNLPNHPNALRAVIGDVEKSFSLSTPYVETQHEHAHNHEHGHGHHHHHHHHDQHHEHHHDHDHKNEHHHKHENGHGHHHHEHHHGHHHHHEHDHGHTHHHNDEHEHPHEHHHDHEHDHNHEHEKHHNHEPVQGRKNA